jgi:peptidoglycan/xylan/chitin deacetylase (PgdA/CDA1 family)
VGLHRILTVPALRGAILMLHRMRPHPAAAYQPNRGLEISPEFLDNLIGRLKQLGYVFVSMDEVPHMLQSKHHSPFIALTADDGYRDNIEYGLPVLRKHNVPLMMYITTGFAKRSSNLWWIDLEEAISRLDKISLSVMAQDVKFHSASHPEKERAFKAIYSILRSQHESVLRDRISFLCSQAGVNSTSITGANCLSVEEISVISKQEPLISFGSHTVNHLMLKQHDENILIQELEASKNELSCWIGKPVNHLAYPVGDASSAAKREFKAAKNLGYATAVIARGGVLARKSEYDFWALPRVFISGEYATIRGLCFQLSGIPYLIRQHVIHPRKIGPS